MRVIIALAGALILFLISWRLGEKLSESYNIDKVFHILMSVCVALFFSVYFQRPVFLILAVLAIGVFYEIYQAWHDIVFVGNHDLRRLLVDSLGDIFADLAGTIFFVWWIWPHIN